MTCTLRNKAITGIVVEWFHECPETIAGHCHAGMVAHLYREFPDLTAEELAEATRCYYDLITYA